MILNNNIGYFSLGLISSIFPNVNTTAFTANDSAQFNLSSVNGEWLGKTIGFGANAFYNLTNRTSNLVFSNSTALLASVSDTTVNALASDGISYGVNANSIILPIHNAASDVTSIVSNLLCYACTTTGKFIKIAERDDNMIEGDTVWRCKDASSITPEYVLTDKDCDPYIITGKAVVIGGAVVGAVVFVGSALVCASGFVEKHFIKKKKKELGEVEKTASESGNIALVEKRQSLQECSTQSDDNIPVNSKENSSKKSLDISDRDQWKFNRQPSTDLESASSESIETKLGLSEV